MTVTCFLTRYIVQSHALPTLPLSHISHLVYFWSRLLDCDRIQDESSYVILAERTSDLFMIYNVKPDFLTEQPHHRMQQAHHRMCCSIKLVFLVTKFRETTVVLIVFSVYFLLISYCDIFKTINQIDSKMQKKTKTQANVCLFRLICPQHSTVKLWCQASSAFREVQGD